MESEKALQLFPDILITLELECSEACRYNKAGGEKQPVTGCPVVCGCATNTHIHKVNVRDAKFKVFFEERGLCSVRGKATFLPKVTVVCVVLLQTSKSIQFECVEHKKR